MKLLLVDDEAPARERLKTVLSDIGFAGEVLEADHAVAAWLRLQQEPVDVVILDINMPEMSGIELAQHLQKLDSAPSIIFATAFDDYALQAFEVNAIDYLVKPVRAERLQAALQKASRLLPAQVAALNGAQKRARSHLAIHERGRIRLVPVKDVIYFKAELKYITVHTEQHDYLLEESLTHLEQEFGERFLRIHRNCLVAREAIAGFERGQSNDDVGWLVVLKNETEKLAVSRRQAHIVKDFRHEKN